MQELNWPAQRASVAQAGRRQVQGLAHERVALAAKEHRQIVVRLVVDGDAERHQAGLARFLHGAARSTSRRRRTRRAVARSACGGVCGLPGRATEHCTALSFAKGLLGILEFLELRHAPALWRWRVVGWLVLVLALIALAHGVARW